MSLDLEKTYLENEETWLVELNGELDINTSNYVKENLNSILDERLSHIRIDCDGLVYIDSTGIGILISILKRVKKGEYSIKFINTGDNIKRLFNVTGLNKVFNIS